MAFYEHGFLVIQDGLGYDEVAVGGSAVGLPSIPDYTPVKRCLIQILGGDIRWMASPDEEPTADRGIRMLDGDFFVYDGDPYMFKMIMDSASSGSPTVGVHYFGNGR